MTGYICSRRFSFRPSFALLLAALLPLLATPAQAVDLRGYKATYKFYQGGMYMANSNLELARNGEHWHWRMKTEARGIYALFTDKEPLTETLFLPTSDELRLHRITVSDAGSGKSSESASFDWTAGELEVNRKGKRRILPLAEGVYDQQTIHWLAAAMLARQQDSLTVNFYRKGKLDSATLSYQGPGNVDLEDKKHAAQVFVQRTRRGKSRLRIFYDAINPTLPLRIEKVESGDTPAVLQLESVDWSL